MRCQRKNLGRTHITLWLNGCNCIIVISSAARCTVLYCTVLYHVLTCGIKACQRGYVTLPLSRLDLRVSARAIDSLGPICWEERSFISEGVLEPSTIHSSVITHHVETHTRRLPRRSRSHHRQENQEAFKCRIIGFITGDS